VATNIVKYDKIYPFNLLGDQKMLSKKLIPTLIISSLLAVACTQTVVETAAPTDTQTPFTDTESPVDTQSQAIEKVTQAEIKSQITEAATPTEATIPTALPVTLNRQSQSACLDSASFVADVTVADNTNFSQGTPFLKTWRIRNTGTCSWDENYSMVFVNGDQMNSPASIPFKVTDPGAMLDVSVDLVAPSVDGAYTGNYELHNAAGQLFLIDNTRYIWVKITVGTGSPQQQNPVAGTVTTTNTPVTNTAGSCTYTENTTLRNDILSLINAARSSNGLPALNINSKLSAAAMSHSIDMACHSSISHTGSDGSSITDRFNAQGYTYSYWNEAIYAQPPQYGGNAQAAVDWWLNDPTHRPILLSPVATEIGIGYALVTSSTLGGYFAVDFGAP
jgi:uncharacterized protein YkwD